MNIVFLFRKEDAIKLDLIHIAKLDNNGTRFFYQKKKFQLPQYVPHSLPGTEIIHLSSIHRRKDGLSTLFLLPSQILLIVSSEPPQSVHPLPFLNSAKSDMPIKMSYLHNIRVL